jgi:UTP--glucose-1-phosphate uridylyltransferase
MADLPAAGATSFTRQQSPLGLGHAVWCARDIIGDEPFAVLLPDMITLPGAGGKRCLQQCLDTYNEHGGNVIAVEQVPMEDTHQYGVVAKGQDFGSSFEIAGMVEKPAKGTAPSNYIISGRYVLEPEIFDLLAKGQKGAGGEIQLTDSMIELAKTQKFFARHFDGKTYDTGSKIGFLAANVAFALARPDIEPGFRAELKRIVGTL